MLLSLYQNNGLKGLYQTPKGGIILGITLPDYTGVVNKMATPIFFHSVLRS
jgi:hypothetical protein